MHAYLPDSEPLSGSQLTAAGFEPRTTELLHIPKSGITVSLVQIPLTENTVHNVANMRRAFLYQLSAIYIRISE